MEFLLAAVAEGSSAKHVRRPPVVEDFPSHINAAEEALVCNGLAGTSVNVAKQNSTQAIEALVLKVRTASLEALKQGLEEEAILPTEAINELAHMVWEAKTASWTSGKEGAPHGLSSLSKLETVLTRIFEETAQLDVETEIASSCPKPSKRKAVAIHCNNEASVVVRLSNIDAGLILAAMYFDTNALLGTPLSIFSDAVGEAAQRFLSHHTRATLVSACSQYDVKSKTMSVLGGAAPRLAGTMARVLRSMHHALAASFYASTPMAHRVSPLALQCLFAATRAAPVLLRTLHSAASDVLISILAQADNELQAALVDDFSKVFETADVVSGKGSDQNGPRALVAVVLHAISAATLPVRVEPCKASELLTVAEQRYANAEKWASSLITSLLRQTLLASERDSDAWSLLQHFCNSLLAVCTDVLWPSAPLLLFAFVKGLAHIANISRSVDVVWTQREFAVKLLGNITRALCKNNLELAERRSRHPSLGADDAAVRQWLSSCGFSNSLEFKRHSEDLQSALIAFVDSSPISSKALWHPMTSSNSSAHLNGAAFPVDHPIFSNSFLLCTWAVQMQGSKLRPAAKNKRNRGKTASKKQQVEEACTQDLVPTWPLTTWSSYALKHSEAHASGASRPRNHEAIDKFAQTLYLEMSYDPQDGLLSHARRLTLETLLSLMKSAPLVHVRRRAVNGISAACGEDSQLIASKCVAEAVAISLQDESALVRFAGVDLIASLVDSSDSAVTSRIGELRAAVQSRLSDASPVVRRAAFRVACSALRMEDPLVTEKIANILRKIQHETAQIRTYVLGSIERTMFKACESVQSHLQSLVTQPGVGGKGVRDLLMAHRAAAEEQIFVASMKRLVVESFQHLDVVNIAIDPTAQALLLEQVSAESPEVVHEHLPRLLSWIGREESSNSLREHGVALSRHACKILSNILPTWQGGGSIGIEAADKLRDMLSALLGSPDVSLVRAAVECFCVVAMHIGGSLAELLEHFNIGVQHLRTIVDQRLELDLQAREEACRHATVIGTILEFLNVEVLLEGSADSIDSDFDLTDLATAATWLLSTLCLDGPPALRPALVPCLGFLLRRYFSLLCTQPAAYDVFKNGLDGTHHNTALEANTLEAVSLLLNAFEKSAEKCVEDSIGANNEATSSSSISEAVQRVAGLQSKVLDVLRVAEAPNVAYHALGALQSMHRLGVLHSSSILPGLLAACLVACRPIASLACQLMMQILEKTPDLLASRFGAGLREAVSLQSARIRDGFKSGKLLSENWRFAVLREAYAELEGRQSREHFLDAVFAEITGLQESRWSAEEVMCLAEFLFGVLAVLPLRYESELAHIVRNSARFLTLRAMPLLPDGTGPAPSESIALGICVASVLLHKLCMTWAEEQDVKRFLAASSFDGGFDQPLPVYSLRRPAPDLSSPLQEIALAAGSATNVLALLAKYVLPDSCLLQGAGTHDDGKGVARRGRKRRAPNLPLEVSRMGA